MPHVLELPLQAHREALYRMSVGQIRPIVRFKGRGLQRTGTHPGGAPIFGTNIIDLDFEISDRIQGNISLSIEKKRFANDDETTLTVSEITLNVVNTDEYFAVTQDGAILSAQDISNAEIQIFAKLEGVSDLLPIYRGRVVSPPVETKGLCSFVIRDIGWNIIKKPILFEYFDRVAVLPLPGGGFQFPGGAISISQEKQGIGVDDFNLLSTERSIQTPNGHIKFYNGLVTFNALGDPVVDVVNNDPSKIKLRTIDIRNGAKPGRYKIEFEGKRTFKVIYPDNSVYVGDILNPFTSPAVNLPLNSWIINNITPTVNSLFSLGYDIDARGVQIEFQVYYSVSGNPGTIIKNLIEKGLAGNVGFFPNTGSAAMPYTQIRVDWPAFNEVEKRFADVCLFVSETNKDNKVWERKIGNQPMSWFRIAQKVADHIACFIVIQSDGLLTIKMPFIDDSTIYDITTEEAIINHSIQPYDQFNYLSVQYAYDATNDSYLVAAESDLRTNADYEENRMTVNAPYYKAGINQRNAEWLRDTFIRHYYNRQVVIELEVTPQMGLPLLPGDKFRLSTREQPKLNQVYCEIKKVEKTIGGTCRLECIPIGDPEGNAFTLCESGFNGDLLF